MEYIWHYECEFGKITIAAGEDALTGLWFDGQKYFALKPGAEYKEEMTGVIGQAVRWLDIYFSGRKPDFTPKLSPEGTDFRKRVWEILLTIPYGVTMTYAQIAKVIADERGIRQMSARAVGGAVGHNPISVIIPCHRVVGSDGKLVGYAGGTELKRRLLELEGAKKGESL